MDESFNNLYVFVFSKRELYKNFEKGVIEEACRKNKVDVILYGNEDSFAVLDFKEKKLYLDKCDSPIFITGTFIKQTVELEGLIEQINKISMRQVFIRGKVTNYAVDISKTDIVVNGTPIHEGGLRIKIEEMQRWFDAIDSNKYHKFYKDNLHVKLSKNPTYNFYQRQSLYAYLLARGFECTDSIFDQWFDNPKESVAIDFKNLKISYKGFDHGYETLHISAFFGRMALFDLRLHNPEITYSKTIYFSPRTNKVYALGCAEEIHWSEIEKIRRYSC